MKFLVIVFTKQSTLMRRSTVLSLPIKLVFLTHDSIIVMTENCIMMPR